MTDNNENKAMDIGAKIQTWKDLGDAKFSKIDQFKDILRKISSSNTKNKLSDLKTFEDWLVSQKIDGTTLCSKILTQEDAFFKWAKQWDLPGGPATALYSAFIEFLKETGILPAESAGGGQGAGAEESARAIKKPKNDHPILTSIRKLLSIEVSEWKWSHVENKEDPYFDYPRKCLNVEFPAALQGRLAIPTLIVRNCFPILADLILQQKDALLWGPSGIGKSTFIFYFITRLRDAGVKRVFVGLQKAEDIVINLSDRTAEFVTERIDLEKQDWAIIDSKDPPAFECHYLFVSSPTQTNARPKFYQFVKEYIFNPNSIFLMPEWQAEELIVFEQLLPDGFTKSEEFWRRFNLIGGIPRKLINVNFAHPAHTADTMLDALIQSCDSDTLKTMVDCMTGGRAIPQHSIGELVQVEERNFRFAGLRFTSVEVRDKIVQAWDRKNKKALRDWIGAASNNQYSAGLAGYLFEGLAHQRFETAPISSSRPIKLKGEILGSRAPCSYDVMVKEVADGSGFNRPMATKVASNSKKACYYRPCVTNLPAFDAFIIQNHELLLFQFTVAKCHGVQGHFLTQFVNAILKKHLDVKTVSLAFVSEKMSKLSGQVQRYVGTKDVPLVNQDVAAGFARKAVLQQIELELLEF